MKEQLAKIRAEALAAQIINGSMSSKPNEFRMVHMGMCHTAQMIPVRPAERALFRPASMCRRRKPLHASSSASAVANK